MTSAIHGFISASRDCAMEMLDNALYIKGELDHVTMSTELRGETERLCDALVGTKHDIIHELSELDDLLEEHTADAPALRFRVERIKRWLGGDVERMHHLVESLDAAKERDAEYSLAGVLVRESATNILTAYIHTKEAAELLEKETEKDRSPMTSTNR